VRYDLGTEFATETLVVFGELYRDGGEWQFRAIGKGYTQDDFIKEYGHRKHGRIKHF
jgi:stress response protein SCP2